METQLKEDSSDNLKDHTGTARLHDRYGNEFKQLSCNDYHIAWVCPVADIELLPARLMLDEEYPTPPYNTYYDENTYICGTINGHAVVVAACPQGETGNVNAGRLTGSMFKTFPNIRMAVLVGIGGGIPRPHVSGNPLDDIHLGDVVVGWPGDGKPACIYHDRGKSKINGQFEVVGTMQNPDWRLTNALSILVSDHKLRRTRFHDQLARLRDFDEFTQPGFDQDRLFKAAYCHVGKYGSNCAACDQNELVQRPQRTTNDKNKFVFHLGRIATGNAVVQNGEERDRISAKCDGALCVEMEAAGVDVNRRCLVIRGISDYADSHKNDVWRSHAAGNAAVFTRELLSRIQPGTVETMEIEAPWLVPFARTPSFAGRVDQLAQLSHHILSTDSQRLAIYGLGGCGKSALALESVYRAREQLPARAIFWVPVVSRETFEQAYREIGTLLRIPGIADGKVDVKRLVREKLSDERFGGWLMIVDNADDVTILFDSREVNTAADPLIDYLPHSRKGSIVFTTRTRAAAIDLAGNNVIELGELSEVEAKELLRTRLLPKHQHQLEDEKVVDLFLKMLAFLALAIVQAAAFINKANSTLSDYTSIYRDREKDAIDLLSKEFHDQGRHQNTKNPVATTWYISFGHIQSQNALAAEYLYFMACTTGENIPASLLLPGGSELEAVEAIGMLDAYAFVTERREKQAGGEQQYQERTFDMHRLVRLATRNWLREHSLWNMRAEKVLARLVNVVPYGNHIKREIWTAYLPHAIHVAGLPEIYNANARMLLLSRVEYCERALGHYKAAEHTLRQLLPQLVEVLGKEHPNTLTSMDHLAQALSNQGKYVEAEKIHRETLVLSVKVWGKEHPDTLVSMNNLALALGNQGKYVEAEKMHRETLVLSVKVLGKEHPDTLTLMNNLAQALSNQGKYVEAEKMYRETLALRVTVSGKEHPATLTIMNNLAQALSDQGKYMEAEKMYREMLVLRVKVSGKEHLDTLRCMNNLALALGNQGKHVEAEKMHRETLVLIVKVSGKEHLATLAIMNNLAQALSDQGKYVEAEKMHRETLALRVTVLGKEHPDTLVSMNNLAQALSRQGKYVEAEKMHRERVALRVKVLGKEHRV